MRFTLAAVLVASGAIPAFSQPTDNIGHDRHTHHHNPKHATEAPTPARFVTSRKSDIVLPLPQETDAFTFVVFGDRTGGPVEGVSVLADAVRDVNLLEPDMVMTVGDLINGYNTTDKWLEQCREFKGIMNELRCPWFPVVGNHDVYWRGPGRPEREHEANYEMHFGPLWYAFKHKGCWFIALHSDEPNPVTGEMNFNKPENHAMSEEQFTWLKETLAKAKGAPHVFLFLHHPRWTKGSNYGDSWDRVHKLLVDAGNVTAVFAGHIHRMRYDPRDGIEYVTLATVGGHQDGKVPSVGWLHHYNVVTVRKEQVAMASFPVGAAMDVREITGELAAESLRMHETPPAITGTLSFQPDGTVRETIQVSVSNPTTHEADVTVALDSADSRWLFAPDHRHARVAPGATGTFEFLIRRAPGGADAFARRLEAVIDADVLLPTHRYALPTRRAGVPMNFDSLPAPTPSPTETALKLDGNDAVSVPDKAFTLPDGPFTLECWINADAFAERTGLLCKTESSDYGLFANGGAPHFTVFLGEGYVNAKAAPGTLTPGRWHHLAGVFDGSEVRLYVDGSLVSTEKATGGRKRNTLPLVIGADVDKDGRPVSFFSGRIDGVRLSTGARYVGAHVTPARRTTNDDATLLLANMDAMLAGEIWAETPKGLLGSSVGAPELVPAE